MKSLKSPPNHLGWAKGSLFKRVEVIRNQIKEVQGQIDKDPHNHDLRIIEENLLKDFYIAESDEEKFLYQQAKVKWLSEGDRNSSYFHKVLKGRRNTSRISTLKDATGICYEDDQIPDLFLKHFTDFLGKAQHVQDIEDCNTLFKKKISNELGHKMISEVSNGEIKRAVVILLLSLKKLGVL
ncbi:hypothetical protein Tco_0145475 [Tanacetum coccineum]